MESKESEEEDEENKEKLQVQEEKLDWQSILEGQLGEDLLEVVGKHVVDFEKQRVLQKNRNKMVDKGERKVVVRSLKECLAHKGERKR